MGIKKEAFEVYAQGAASALSDAVVQSIVEKARKYDVAMFQNPDLLMHLCDTSSPPCALSNAACEHVASLLTWLVESQNAAQLSGDNKKK